jgi:hypothetical protein
MNAKRIQIALLFSFCVLMPQIARAQTEIQSSISGKLIRWETNGNITLNGACFGGVTSLPTGEVVTLWPGKGVAKNGNLYFTGALNFNSVSFSDDIVVRSGGTTLASISPTGVLNLKGKCNDTAGCSNTTWEPSKWNDGGFTQSNNNCYNYGNDKITNTFAQPGKASGQQWTVISVDNVKAAALRDGLRWVDWNFPGNTYDCGDGHLIFMTIAPNFPPNGDYHWMRLDQTKGVWSHKPGGGSATNLDNSNATITNPLTANRGLYTQNGGFYCTCGSLANIN